MNIKCCTYIDNLSYKIKLPLRDGTIIGMFILGPLLGFFINLLEPAYLKYKLMKSPDEDL